MFFFCSVVSCSLYLIPNTTVVAIADFSGSSKSSFFIIPSFFNAANSFGLFLTSDHLNCVNPKLTSSESPVSIFAKVFPDCFILSTALSFNFISSPSVTVSTLDVGRPSLKPKLSSTLLITLAVPLVAFPIALCVSP